MSGAIQVAVRVADVAAVAPDIRLLRLVARDGQPLPPYSAGSHTVVTFEADGRTVKNPYSLLGTTLSGGAYEIAVLKVPHSRGGSSFIHERVAIGSELTVSAPVNLFAVNRTGRRHILVAGGIGLTAISAMADELSALNAAFEIHCAMRGIEGAAFAERLLSRHGDRLRLYVSERRERLAVRDVLMHQPLGSHLYVCGPERMIDAILADARGLGWPETSLHAERFLAPAGGAPFSVRLARSGLSAMVGEHQTLLEAIEDVGVDAPYLCRGGACGQCETIVVSADGHLDHHDHFLSAPQKAAGDRIMICVSRLKGRELVLDL